MRAARVQARAIVLGAIALVIVPVGVAEFPRELSRWHHAAALNAWYDGDADRALGQLDRALEWNPRGVDLLLQRADWRIKQGHYEDAIADCELASELDPDDVGAILTRTIGLQFLGRHREAVDVWSRFLEVHRGRFPLHNLLNARAYARALGRLELDEGLEDANESLTRLRRIHRQRDLWLPESLLVAPEGYFQATWGIEDLYRRDDAKAAIVNLGRAETSVRSVLAPLDAACRRRLEDGDPLGELGERRQAAATLLAAILYVRSEARQSLDEPADADDRDASAKLDPQLDQPRIRTHSIGAAMLMARENAMVLDTRGYLQLRRRQMRPAFQDLVLAVELAEQLTDAIERLFDTNAFFLDEDYRAAQGEVATTRHTLAVIYYHRAQLYLAMGQQGKARTDLIEVRRLGFEPGDNLF